MSSCIEHYSHTSRDQQIVAGTAETFEIAANADGGHYRPINYGSQKQELKNIDDIEQRNHKN